MVAKAPLFGLLLVLGGMSVAASPLAQISFSADVQRIFDRRCVVCHTSGDHVGELVLDRGSSYAQLVGVPSVESAIMSRVKPGRPLKSYLFRKIQGTHLAAEGLGWQMPPPSSTSVALTVAERRTIELWIRQGARNN